MLYNANIKAIINEHNKGQRSVEKKGSVGVIVPAWPDFFYFPK